jgi:hypothetical protein
MTKPRRLQLSRKRGWRKPQGAIVCSRPGRWGNPFTLHSVVGASRGRRGASSDEGGHAERSARLQVVRRFEQALCAGELVFTVHDVRIALRNRDLACWCPLCPTHALGKPWDTACGQCAPCHVDVLLEKANE